MHLELDENLPPEIAGDLRDGGRDVATFAQAALASPADRLAVAESGRERRIVLTRDGQEVRR